MDIIIKLLMGVTVLSAVGTTIKDTSFNLEQEEIEVGEANDNLEVFDKIIMTRNSISVDLSGGIENNSSIDYTFIQIAFNLYDEKGALVGIAIDSISELKPGEIWNYSATAYLYEDMAVYTWELYQIVSW